MDSENLQVTSVRKANESWKVGLIVYHDGDTLAFVELEPLEAQLFASVLAIEGEKANLQNANQGLFGSDPS